MIGDITIDKIPKEIFRTIEEVSVKVRDLSSKVEEFDAEKIYDSYIKVDEFRQQLYQIDLLSQGLMDAYRLYAAYAAQAMVQQGQAQEPEHEPSPRRAEETEDAQF